MRIAEPGAAEKCSRGARSSAGLRQPDPEAVAEGLAAVEAQGHRRSVLLAGDAVVVPTRSCSLANHSPDALIALAMLSLADLCPPPTTLNKQSHDPRKRQESPKKAVPTRTITSVLTPFLTTMICIRFFAFSSGPPPGWLAARKAFLLLSGERLGS